MRKIETWPNPIESKCKRARITPPADRRGGIKPDPHRHTARARAPQQTQHTSDQTKGIGTNENPTGKLRISSSDQETRSQDLAAGQVKRQKTRTAEMVPDEVKPFDEDVSFRVSEENRENHGFPPTFFLLSFSFFPELLVCPVKEEGARSKLPLHRHHGQPRLKKG